MQPKKILITGITGQDGSYMAEYCLKLGHKVYGMIRRTSTINDKNFNHLYANPNFKRVYGDLLDSTSLDNLIREIQPDYFINFAAQSFVGVSWQIPEETFMASAVGVLKCLEAIRRFAPSCRFYNAGSSEQFGDVLYSPQDEKHPFRPRSPYGAGKASADFLVKVYRESYGIYAIQGLLFNHESERRGEEFVTRKITKGIARIKKALLYCQKIEPIQLGNIYAKRDWSHAEDFVDGVWRMLNQEQFNDAMYDQIKGYPLYYPKGGYTGCEHKLSEMTATKEISKLIKAYVLASGETHTIKEFVEKAFQAAGIVGCWRNIGKGQFKPEDEVFMLPTNVAIVEPDDQNILVKIDPAFYRPNEVNLLIGNSSLARQDLNWTPKITFDMLAKRMVSHDLYEAGIYSPNNNGNESNN